MSREDPLEEDPLEEDPLEEEMATHSSIPFPELHKEGIKQTGNHPNRRIKTLMESV